MAKDFRDEAAEATLSQVRSAGSVADVGASACQFVPGGRVLRCLIELPSLALILGCWGALMGAGWLAAQNVLTVGQALALVTACMLIALSFRKIRSVLLKQILRWREGSLLEACSDLPTRAIAIEDSATVQQVKILTEDEGVLLLDEMRQRILIEGCSFRHVIYARDVEAVGAVSGYALSAARLVCEMGGKRIDMVIKSAGQGPLGSFTQAFFPHVQAAGLASVLNRTLFGEAAPNYSRNAPPPLPQPG